MGETHGHQRGIIIFFAILLIVMLIFMAIVLKHSDAEKKWPPVISECPDYWYDSYYDMNVSGDSDSDSNGTSSCPANSLTRQINDSSSYSNSDDGDTRVGSCYNVQDLGDSSCPKTMDFSDDYWTGTDGLCHKWTWAKKCDITWDGITDQSNPCTAEDLADTS